MEKKIFKDDFWKTRIRAGNFDVCTRHVVDHNTDRARARNLVKKNRSDKQRLRGPIYEPANQPTDRSKQNPPLSLNLMQHCISFTTLVGLSAYLVWTRLWNCRGATLPPLDMVFTPPGWPPPSPPSPSYYNHHHRSLSRFLFILSFSFSLLSRSLFSTSHPPFLFFFFFSSSFSLSPTLNSHTLLHSSPNLSHYSLVFPYNLLLEPGLFLLFYSVFVTLSVALRASHESLPGPRRDRPFNRAPRYRAFIVTCVAICWCIPSTVTS